MLPAFEKYCRLIAGFADRHKDIRSSGLTVYTIGPMTAEVEGQLLFNDDYTLDVWKLIDLSARAIRSYSYELIHKDERVLWHDPTDHPHIPALQSTNPHHKHVQPNIRHNRVPAPNICFDQPNLPNLIEEVAALLSSA